MYIAEQQYNQQPSYNAPPPQDQYNAPPPPPMEQQPYDGGYGNYNPGDYQDGGGDTQTTIIREDGGFFGADRETVITTGTPKVHAFHRKEYS